VNAPRICKHCNGTTYCGGSISRTSGKLKTQPACPTCLVKSRLDPAGIFERVVCSVCRGTGLVDSTAHDVPRTKKVPAWVMIAVAVVCVTSVLFLAATVYFYYRESLTPDDIRRALLDQSRAAARESSETIRDRVSVGMSGDYVQWVLGDPDGTRQISSDESVLELWQYECRDGARVQISILDGKVQAITQ